jgi:spore germination protein D
MNATCLRIVPVFLILFLLISCGSNSQQSSQGQQTQGYKDTKTMVIDVLKTTEGQKAIQEAGKTNQDPTMKLLSTGDGQQIQMAVKDILTNPMGSKMIEKTMTDPKFAGDFAKTIQQNNKQIHKDLMKDPDYQKSMLEVMNNPEYQKLIMTTMKNTVYRQQMMNVIQESMQSPLFKMQLMDLLKKVVQDGVTPKVETMSEKSGGGGGQGGGGGSAGGSSKGGSDQSSGDDQQKKSDEGKDKKQKSKDSEE